MFDKHNKMKQKNKGFAAISELILESAIKSVIKKTSRYKIRILRLLKKNQPKFISEIQRHLGISYKETYRHIKEMKELGYIRIEIQKKTKHKPVFVYLTDVGKFILDLSDRGSIK